MRQAAYLFWPSFCSNSPSSTAPCSCFVSSLLHCPPLQRLAVKRATARETLRNANTRSVSKFSACQKHQSCDDRRERLKLKQMAKRLLQQQRYPSIRPFLRFAFVRRVTTFLSSLQRTVRSNTMKFFKYALAVLAVLPAFAAEKDSLAQVRARNLGTFMLKSDPFRLLSFFFSQDVVSCWTTSLISFVLSLLSNYSVMMTVMSQLQRRPRVRSRSNPSFACKTVPLFPAPQLIHALTIMMP